MNSTTSCTILYETCSLGSVETSSKTVLKHNQNFIGNLISIKVATIKVKKNKIESVNIHQRPT
jgi:hypothetical protein